jgi:hypothetical protein
LPDQHSLSHGNEVWTIRRNDERRPLSAEMRFVRRTAGYALSDHKRNKEVMKELHIQ